MTEPSKTDRERVTRSGGVEEYRIVGRDTISDLEREVRKWLSKGWIPFGGVSESERGFYQAMVR